MRVKSRVMSNMLYLNAQGFKTFVTDIGEHAATMVQSMWQDVICGVAVCIKACLGVYCGIDPDGGQASDQPKVAGKDVKCVSLSLSLSLSQGLTLC